MDYNLTEPSVSLSKRGILLIESINGNLCLYQLLAAIGECYSCPVGMRSASQGVGKTRWARETPAWAKTAMYIKIYWCPDAYRSVSSSSTAMWVGDRGLCARGTQCAWRELRIVALLSRGNPVFYYLQNAEKKKILKQISNLEHI